MPGERCLACMKPLAAGAAHCPNCGSSVPCPANPPDSLQPGYILGNRFVIGKVIGRGGYGISYIAFDNRLQTTRCIKEYFPQKCRRRPDMSPEVIPGREQEFQRFSDRFLQEARIMSSMSEEKVSNVVNVFDQLNLNGTTYILMEYLDGCTLDEFITRQKKGLPWKEAVRDIKAVLQTLEEIHRHGYLHRDISLSNVFRMQDGSVRVIDFGSAEPIETAKNHPGNMWPSSKRYYSPEEQITNSVQGPWTDVYAAGACLFKAVAGGWPPNQRNGEVYPSLRSLGFDVPEGLDRIINKATQQEPRKRYSTAAAMLDALSRIEDGEAEPLRPDAKKPDVPKGEILQQEQWQQIRMPRHEEWSAVPVEPDTVTIAQQTNKKKKSPVALIAVLAAVVAIVAGTVIYFMSRPSDDGKGTGGAPDDAVIITPEPDPECTVIWLNGDGSELDRKTYRKSEEEPTTDRIPEKAADEDYVYTFSGWDRGTTDGYVKTYRPRFTATARTEMTVIWLNGDGSELDRKTYKEGQEEPTTDAIPTKAEDEDNTYAFTGWDQGTVDGNVKTYRPQFAAVAKPEYTVIWLNGDGSELDRKTYKEGAAEPTTDKVPEKAADDDNVYTFAGWDNGTTEGNVKTYRPQFITTAKTEYIVIWLNGDGTVLDRKTYKEGEAEPTTDKIPEKAMDENNMYTFAGWDEETMEGTVKIYQPKFTATARAEYTVIWLDGDGSELDRKAYKEGADEPKTEKTPVKAEDEDNIYQFTGWDKGTVDGNTKTYRPQFETVRKQEYTVIWLNGDGSELDRKTYKEGQNEPKTEKTPVKAEDEDNTYQFTGWDKGTVDGNVKTYRPQFETVRKQEYTVIWLNGDGSELDRKTYKEGQDEPKTEKTPVKAEDEDNTYKFTGWDKGTVDGNTKTYRPQFETIQKQEYTVIWLNGDGSELDRKTYKEDQDEPKTEKTPVKAEDEDNTYKFTGWDDGTVDGNVKTYHPQFETIPKQEYIVIWLNGDGSELDRKTYKEGQDEPKTEKTPVKAEDEDNTYQFTGWDDGTVEGNVKTYRPQFETIPKQEYTVIWLNGDGSELDRKTYKEGAPEPTTDKIPVKEDDEDYTYTFTGWDKGTVDGNTKTYRPLFEAKAKPKYESWYVKTLDARQSDESGDVSYTIKAVCAENMEVEAWIVTADGGKQTGIPLEKVDASEISVPDGMYVHADIGWVAKGKLRQSDLPEGESRICLYLMENGTEKDSKSSDPMQGKTTESVPEPDEFLNDQLGYVCYIDNLSRLDFNVKKGKAFVSGYVFSDTAMVLTGISYSIDDNTISGNGGANAILKGYDRADAAASRQALEASGFTVGSKNQGCFAVPLNTKRLAEGYHEVTVTFTFNKTETVSYSTRFSITTEADEGDIIKDAKTMLSQMGYQ